MMTKKMSFFNMLLYALAFVSILSQAQAHSTPLANAGLKKTKAKPLVRAAPGITHHARHYLHRNVQQQQQQQQQQDVLHKKTTTTTFTKQHTEQMLKYNNTNEHQQSQHHHQHQQHEHNHEHHHEQQHMQHTRHHHQHHRQHYEHNNNNERRQEQQQHAHAHAHAQPDKHYAQTQKMHTNNSKNNSNNNNNNNIYYKQNEGSEQTTAKSSSRTFLGISASQQSNDNTNTNTNTNANTDNFNTNSNNNNNNKMENNDNNKRQKAVYLEAVTANTHNKRHGIGKPMHLTDTSFLLHPMSIMSTNEHTQESGNKLNNNKNHNRNRNHNRDLKKHKNNENALDSQYDDYANNDSENDKHNDDDLDDSNADDVDDDDDDEDDDDDDEDDGEETDDFYTDTGHINYDGIVVSHNTDNDDNYDDDVDVVNDYDYEYKLSNYQDNRLSEHRITRVPREYHHSYPHSSQESAETNLNLSHEHHNHNHTLTEEKFKHYGTMEAVQRSHHRYFPGVAERELAKKHRERMEMEARCSRPMKRVIYISNETSRNYIPRCTILYRCGDDTGCCRSITEVCTNKTAELINIYVFVSEGVGSYYPQKISMYNHTECHCVRRVSVHDAYAARDKRASAVAITAATAMRVPSVAVKRNERERMQLLDNVVDCQCPTHFNNVTQQRYRRIGATHYNNNNNNQNGIAQNCYCDCFSDNMTCQRLKNGIEGFALDDRRCIQRQKCQLPACAYGEYNKISGRCPRRAQFEGIG